MLTPKTQSNKYTHMYNYDVFYVVYFSNRSEVDGVGNQTTRRTYRNYVSPPGYGEPWHALVAT